MCYKCAVQEKKKKLTNTLGAGEAVDDMIPHTSVGRHYSLCQNNKLTISLCFAVSPKFMQAHTQTIESGCSGAAVPGSLKGVWTRGCVTGVPGGLNPGHLLK